MNLSKLTTLGEALFHRIAAGLLAVLAILAILAILAAALAILATALTGRLLVLTHIVLACRRHF